MQLRSEINVTPLVDVVLVLLIIFMVVTPLVFQGYDVTVPSKGSTAKGKVIFVEQKEATVVLLDQTAVPVNQLSDRLRKLFMNRDRLVIYSGADHLIYDDVVQTLDAIRNAGAEKIGIAATE